MEIDGLIVGREYLLRAPGVCVLAIFDGVCEVPGDVRDRTLPRFAPVRWLRGAPDDPRWPFYAGPRARWRAMPLDGFEMRS